MNELFLIVTCLILIIGTPGAYDNLNHLLDNTISDLFLVYLSIFVFMNLFIILLDQSFGMRLHYIRRQNIIGFRDKNRHHAKLINKRNVA